MSATGYNIPWLEDRFFPDSNARSEVTLHLFKDQLKDLPSLEFIDLGSGIGNNVQFLSGHFHQDQYWRLIEIDPALVAYGIPYLEQFFRHVGYQITQKSEDSLKAAKPGGNSVFVKYYCESMFHPGKDRYQGINGITGNGILDVFTAHEIDCLFQILPASIPKLFTITYRHMEWHSGDPDDPIMTHAYHQHMIRQQDGGCALGPAVMDYIARIITSQNLTLVTDKSNWILKPSDHRILSHILDFYQQSIPEILSGRQLQKFNLWMKEKFRLLALRDLSATVFHEDIFIHKTD